MSQPRTLNMLIAALGGEGGGVLTNWLIDIADRSGWHCQSTSLAGVAQRTGATIYYLEFIPRQDDKPYPVMSLFPAQGDIDVAVTSEIAEAGRMLSRGFISPERTTLISSDHRVFGITEKSATTDGTVDPQVIIPLVTQYARRCVHFDIAELVKRHGTVISAGLLGAIAGAGVLPFEQSVFLEVISEGRGADANRAAFTEAAARAAQQETIELNDDTMEHFQLPVPSSAAGRQLLPRIASMPAVLHEVLFHGAQRLVDYQDVAYASTYLDRVETLLNRDQDDTGYVLTREVARWLALWMAFEDIPRVAQLKLRPLRVSEIREEVQASDTQPLQVREFFHPRVEEVVALLPAGLGRRIYQSELLRSVIAKCLGPRTLRTDTILVSLTLRGLAALRRGRRKSLGYAHEWSMIDRWYNAVLAAPNHDLAQAIADAGRMVKGYGATRHRTTERLMRLLDAVAAGHAITGASVRQLQDAAMAGEDPKPFEMALAQLT